MSFYGYNEKEMCMKDHGGKDYCEKEKYREKETEKEKEREYGEWDYCDCKFAKHLRKYVGETVTVFTASGGVSGCGFTGFLIDVDCCFIRLVNKQGSEPTCPLGSACCCENDGPGKDVAYKPQKPNYYTVGSVTDIPIDQIVAFTHNAV